MNNRIYDSAQRNTKFGDAYKEGMSYPVPNRGMPNQNQYYPK